MYVNVGARYINSDNVPERVPSKRFLTWLVKHHPDLVVFDPTSPFNDPGPIAGDAVPSGQTLSVVGPDPYTSRKWYASVSINSTGKVTVK